MKKVKKIIILSTVGLILFGLNFIPMTVGAQSSADDTTIIQRLTNTGVAAGYEGVSTYSFPHAIGRIIQVFLSILGVVFMAYIIWAGYLWMIARGDEEKVTKSKAIIRGSIIGLIIVLAAYIITATVIDRFTTIGGQDIIQGQPAAEG